jgi:hypothetical protein
MTGRIIDNLFYDFLIAFIGLAPQVGQFTQAKQLPAEHVQGRHGEDLFVHQAFAEGKEKPARNR